MSSVRTPAPESEEQIRAVYEEFDADAGHVGLISDPENDYAWIQSDVTVPITA